MSRTFIFGSGRDFREDGVEEEESPFQRLLDAAGGGSLPGRLGLVQALLNVWTQPRHSHPALHYPKIGLQTVGLVQKYRKSNEEVLRERENKLATFLTERKMEIPSGFKKLSHLVYAYSDQLPHKDMVVGEKVKDYLRVYDLGDGIEFIYVFYTPDSHMHQSGENHYFGGKGPYVRKEQVESFLQKMSERIWESEGHSDLQLSGRNVKWGENDFVLSNIGDPDDYVSQGAEVTWKSVELLGERCKAFQRNNISRKLIFYGSPGTGKSSLSRNLARYIGHGHTLRIEASAIESAGTQAVTEFINLLRPRVILFDDLDRCEDEAVEMLHYMEQASDPKAIKYSTWTNGLIVIGTVNTLEALDPALLRPGRFDEVIEISEPEDEHRLSIVKFFLKKYNVEMDPVMVSERTKGFAPADIKEVVKCISTVGVEVFNAEIGRVMLQRELYSGDACKNFLIGYSEPKKKVSLDATTSENKVKKVKPRRKKIKTKLADLATFNHSAPVELPTSSK